jgi:hypothetical protein
MALRGCAAVGTVCVRLCTSRWRESQAPAPWPSPCATCLLYCWELGVEDPFGG